MITVSLSNVGKKFGREWIFRGVSRVFQPGDRVAILGGNGSGKSTLLQVIAGFITPNEGTIETTTGERALSPDQLASYVSFASPYLQLIEEFTLREHLLHCFSIKKCRVTDDAAHIAEHLQLGSSIDKPVRQFSSGMKQRLRLGLAVLADTPLLMLDEPSSNLDAAGIEWYSRIISEHSRGRTIIVCSNALAHEYAFCDATLSVTDYKIRG